ncbi:MAG: efflux RND transporter permease subunit [Desulfobacteraceae bacterium]|nr:efflux RND transporter permease subunit [Desulfobacteraceae bacterium]
MNRMIAWFAANHVAANLLMVFILVVGVAMAVTNKVEVMPETTENRISIRTAYPGASPAEVESAIIRRIEEQISGLAGIKRINSYAREGYGRVTIEVIPNWDIRRLLDEVKVEVEGISSLPEEAERPVVSEEVDRHEVIDVAIFGNVSEETIKQVTERVRDDIAALPGITLVEPFAVRSDRIHVEISEHTLRQYGLTLEDVAQKIRGESLDLPAGSIKTATGDIMIRTKGRMYAAGDYRNIVILSTPEGGRIRLGQIADIRDGFTDSTYTLRFMGQPGAGVNVYRVADQNALTVADQVKTYIDRIRPALPEGVGIDYIFDESRELRSRILLLLRNLSIGLFLVALLLCMVLNVKLAFWVTLGIPISFAFCTAIMPFLDVSINMISLAAFITVLGIVVDDAIIIGENIFRKLEEGLPPLEAAVKGAQEVGTPVIFSVLTTIVAFMPLLFGASEMGQILRNVPLVVILVLLGSLVESLYILPCHLAGRHRISRQAAAHLKESRISAALKRVINGPYTRLLLFCLRWRYPVLAAGVGVLIIIAGTFPGGVLKFTLFPDVEGDMMWCKVTMPQGTRVERTVEVLDRLELAAGDALEALGRNRKEGAPPLMRIRASLIGGHSGGTGENLGIVWVVLSDGEYRTVTMDQMTKAWREHTGEVPDAESVNFEGASFKSGNAFEVHLSMEETDRLLAAAENLKTELRTYPGIVDVSDSYEQGKTEMQFNLKPSAQTIGISLDQLARQVRHAFHGAEALRMLRDKDEVRVIVRYPENERQAIGSVEEMRVRTGQGIRVPFRQVADVNMVEGYAAIRRTDRRSIIKVYADVDEALGNAKDIRTDVLANVMPKMQALYPGLVYSLEGEGREEEESMTDVYLGFAVALFCIYALLAIPFKSFSQPTIIMSAIPFGLAGAVIGHLLMGFNISLVSLVGMVGLTGVVVNDSLVLVHAVNRLRNEGVPLKTAVVQAGGMRFRAILLTSVTTFAGLTPILLESSLQAKFLIPMAISLGFGVLFATITTLLMVPCVYMIHEDMGVVMGRFFRTRQGRGGLVQQNK